MSEIPKIAWPFFIGPNGEPPITMEQDSQEDMEQRVEMVCRFPIGYRIDLPQFGIPDNTFAQQPVDIGPIESAILRWEPRVKVLIEEVPDTVRDTLDNIIVRFEG